jgi:hypothetical protein
MSMWLFRFLSSTSAWVGNMADWVSAVFAIAATVCAFLALRQAERTAQQSNGIARANLRAHILPISVKHSIFEDGTVDLTVKNFGPGVGTLVGTFTEFESPLGDWFSVGKQDGVVHLEDRCVLIPPGECYSFKVLFEEPGSNDLDFSRWLLAELWVAVRDDSTPETRWFQSKLRLRDAGTLDERKVCRIDVFESKQVGEAPALNSVKSLQNRVGDGA